MIRVRSTLAAGALLCAGLAMTVTSHAATRYVFATFLGDAADKQKLSLYTSKNGLDFTLFADTGYTGPTGVLRDPSITKHTDGNYYIAYTIKSWTTTSSAFAIASSPDLKSWTFRAEIPAQVSGVKDTWAPEWFKDSDGSIHLIVSIDTNDTAFKSYLYTASDDTLTQWSAPKPLGIGPNYIDTFVVKVGATYHAFSKNETSKYIEHATATALTGPWTFTDTGNWAGWGSGKEGPALFQLDDGQWRMFMDCYGSCGTYLQATSNDLLVWSGSSTVSSLSGKVRHGTVLREGDSSAGSGGTSSGGTSGGGTSGGGTSSGGTSGGSESGAGTSSGGTSGNAGGSAGNASGGGAAGFGNGSGSAGAIATGGSPNGGGSAGASATGGARPAQAGAAGDDATSNGDGCSCAVPGSASNSQRRASVALLLTLGAALLRRRAQSPSR